LNQNYLNPFDPTTVIGYQLPEYGNVKLKVYDLLGRDIKTLVNSFQNAGGHSIVWDATDNSDKPVSSGIYSYKMESNGMSFQKKMMLVR
jgi:flagellar hook assembly protein FlgD